MHLGAPAVHRDRLATHGARGAARATCSTRIRIAFELHFDWYRSLCREPPVAPGRVLAQLPSPLGGEYLGVAFAAILRERARHGHERLCNKTPANVSALETIFAGAA
jgi:hypothetical protein